MPTPTINQCKQCGGLVEVFLDGSSKCATCGWGEPSTKRPRLGPFGEVEADPSSGPLYFDPYSYVPSADPALDDHTRDALPYAMLDDGPRYQRPRFIAGRSS